ncbi:uncharacterized protein LOC132131987 [Carassius carassius]|uniref:uncharacterized protein LOC132131987 n=1 Tax=Carassius carassius TaxID=217509 RepID=UPI002868DE19|nr:uncharacterized protein LOC132131987 [Carassius carassius]
MAEKQQAKFIVPAYAVSEGKPDKKRKTVTVQEKAMNKKSLDKQRNKTRINIGVAFQRWRELRELKGLKSDSLMALFLLDSYEKDISTSTPSKSGFTMPPPPVSTTVSESLSDRDDDFSVPGVEELDSSSVQDKNILELDASMSSLDLDVISEDEFNNIKNSIRQTKEIDTDYDDSDDENYMPHICVRTGGALKTPICLDSLQTISMEDTVHDAENNSQDPTIADIHPIPETAKIMVEDDIIGQPASITYHSCLKLLAEYLVLPVNMCTAKDTNTNAECGAHKPFEVNIHSRGTAAIVEWICCNGHTVWKWSSQPNFKYGMLAGDFMLACNILLSGNNYAKISLLFKFMNMGMVEKSSFFRIQNSYCVDTIKEFWKEKRADIIAQIQSKGPIVALGDARMDSPGFCAQYCTYSTMENETKHIISMVNIDKRETMRNSVVMEKEAFQQTFEALHKEINLTEICTDAHSQISALFNKGKYRDSGVYHTLDVWHGSKNLSKKIHAAGQQKGCAILQMWNKDICNHFWDCCKTADTYEEFIDMWVGVLHHVTGEHTWALGECKHGPLLNDRDKELIESGSVAHERLAEIILDERWLKVVPKYLNFRSTADLESFHNHILMYASKRFSFSPPVYAVRTMLAGLDYNHHLHRPARRKADGTNQ